MTISKTIYLTYKSKDSLPTRVIENWKNLNPDRQIEVYGDKECREFLSLNYSDEHTELFDFLEDGPIKSDFWRICILAKNGGAYADADIVPIKALDSYIPLEQIDFLSCLSRYHAPHLPAKVGVLNPHFIICKANDPILTRCIEIYMKGYLDKVAYSYWTYSIVKVMSAVLQQFIPRNKITPGFIQTTNPLSPETSSSKTLSSNIRRYQFLREISHQNGEVMCIWNGEVVLKNRPNDGSYQNHQFINS